LTQLNTFGHSLTNWIQLNTTKIITSYNYKFIMTIDNVINTKRKKIVLVAVSLVVLGLMIPSMNSLDVLNAFAAKPDGPPLPKVLFITTGGTIANLKNDDGSSSRIPLQDVITNIRANFAGPAVSVILDSIDPSFVQVTLVGSGSFDLNTVFLPIAKEAQDALKGKFDAVIITQGTVSSEDTCYFVNLLVNTEKPIIVTNSQRQHGSVGNDGDRNLLDSILVATDPQSVGKGALLVEGSKISACREVLKNSDRPGAFGSQRMGEIGWVNGGTLSTATCDVCGFNNSPGSDPVVKFYREPTRQHTSTSEFSIKALTNPDGTFKDLPRVEVLVTGYGFQPDLLAAYIGLTTPPVEGIVLQGMAPSGIFPGTIRPAITALADTGFPIVQVSRNANEYNGVGVSGSGTMIKGDDLPQNKARILFQLALEKTDNLSGQDRIDEIQRLFNTH